MVGNDGNDPTGDLAYVRGVVTRSEKGATPAGIYLFWAAATLVGFALIDFRPHVVGTYWMVVFPIGWVLSGWLAWRHARTTGQDDRRSGRLHALHWLVMFGGVGLAALLPALGLVAWPVMGPLALLVVAVAYLLAGVHLDRLLLWPGALMAAGYVVLLFEPAFSWTVVGVLVAGGLVVAALAGGRARGAAPA